MSIDLGEHLAMRLRQVAEMWGQDLEAHAGDLNERATPTARSIADIAFETILVNGRIAARLKGEAPPPMEGFPQCPSELRTAEALTKAMADSAELVLQAAGDPSRTIVRPDGSEASAFATAEFAGLHMMYHLGQLNYVQTVDGDLDVHWR